MEFVVTRIVLVVGWSVEFSKSFDPGESLIPEFCRASYGGRRFFGWTGWTRWGSALTLLLKVSKVLGGQLLHMMVHITMTDWDLRILAKLALKLWDIDAVFGIPNASLSWWLIRDRGVQALSDASSIISSPRLGLGIRCSLDACRLTLGGHWSPRMV